MALSRPRGKATIMAPTEVSMVAVIKGQIPKLLEENRGVHLVLPKYSSMETSWKNRTASKRRTETIPTVVKMETAVQNIKTSLMRFSGRYLLHRGPNICWMLR